MVHARSLKEISFTFAGGYSGLVIMVRKRSPPRRITIEQRDKRPEERQDYFHMEIRFLRIEIIFLMYKF
jgi:plastocyanin domain-containing protein